MKRHDFGADLPRPGVARCRRCGVRRKIAKVPGGWRVTWRAGPGSGGRPREMDEDARRFPCRA